MQKPPNSIPTRTLTFWKSSRVFHSSKIVLAKRGFHGYRREKNAGDEELQCLLDCFSFFCFIYWPLNRIQWNLCPENDTYLVFRHAQSASLLQTFARSDKSEESELNETSRHLEALSKAFLGDYEDTNLFTLKSHMIEAIRTFIRKETLRRGSTMDEALKLINTAVVNDECGSKTKGRKRTVNLVQDGILAVLTDIKTSSYSSLAHSNKDTKKLITLRSSKIVQNSFQT